MLAFTKAKRLKELEGGNAIRETARLTDSQMELDNDENEKLNQKLLILRDHLKEYPQITVTYFLPDMQKSGGSYLTVSGSLRNIDDYEQKFRRLYTI